MNQKIDILSMDMDALSEYMKTLGEPGFRAGQIFEWLHAKRAVSFEEMTNVSKTLRQKLDSECYIPRPSVADLQISGIDGTRKYLFAMEDGAAVESVLMKYEHGYSVCISSQVGCRMGCRFCASTIGGLVRNLRPSEMAGQIYGIEAHAGVRVSNIVVMGTGEPLDNFDNLLSFIRIINDPHGINISARNITVSTCGLVEKMRKLADEKLQITLAISLHAPDQEKREKLMPVAKSVEIHELVKTAAYYFETTGRRITFEYALVAGENDSEEDAEKLADLLGGLNAHVNLIPVNPVTEAGFRQPDRSSVTSFLKKLEKKGINGTIRREMGRDIDGACGQLRRKHLS